MIKNSWNRAEGAKKMLFWGFWGRGTKDMAPPPRGGGVQAKISGIKNIRKKFSGIKVYALSQYSEEDCIIW